MNYDVTPKKSYLDNTGYTVKLGWKPVTEEQLPKVGRPAILKGTRILIEKFA